MKWWHFVPEVVVAAGLGLFAITERSAATSAFGSTKAIALMAAVAASWIGVRVALLRAKRWPLAQLALFMVAALAILKVVVFPAYDNKTVVEVSPVSASPATAAVVRTGMLQGINHRASGGTTLTRLADGSLTVGLEDIDIQPGPDYDVFVVPGAGQDDKSGGTRLDDLRGNKGTQYYAVPTGVTVDAGAWTVLVWCQTFDVPVANATLG